ncbi:MMPL family transporter, partial [Actinoplanes philippinensis]
MPTLATWCARRRFAVAGAWIVALLALAALTIVEGAAFTGAADLPDSDSATVYALLDTGGPATTSGNLVWRGSDPAAATAMVTEIKTLPGVRGTSAPVVDSPSSTSYVRVTLDADADPA